MRLIQITLVIPSLVVAAKGVLLELLPTQQGPSSFSKSLMSTGRPIPHQAQSLVQIIVASANCSSQAVSQVLNNERLQVIIQNNNAKNDALRGGRSSAVDPGARYKDRADRLSERAKTSGTPNPSTYGGSREIGRVQQRPVRSYQETPQQRRARLNLERQRKQEAGPYPEMQEQLDQPQALTPSVVLRQRQLSQADELLKRRNRRGRLLGNWLPNSVIASICTLRRRDQGISEGVHHHPAPSRTQ